jgi:hypothetical protein
MPIRILPGGLIGDSKNLFRCDAVHNHAGPTLVVLDEKSETGRPS